MNPRFEALIVAAGRNPSALPQARDDGPEEFVYAPIEALVSRERLSKEEERAKGKMNINSIDIQHKKNEAYAKREGLPILRHFADSDLSGEIFEQGPNWKRMVEYLENMPAKKRETTAITFKDPTRMGRELRKMLNVLHDLEQMHVRVRFSDYPFMAPETMEGWLQFVDFAKMATWERLVIKVRTQDALDERVARGVHLGHFPKHFKKDSDGRIEPDKVAEDVVRLRLGGLSYIEIGRRVGISDDEAYSICVFIRSEVERLAIRLQNGGGE